MKYRILLAENAQEDIQRFRDTGDIHSLHKISTFLSELENHPQTGTGKPERLKGNLSGKWSRRINNRHRLIYEIHDEVVTVIIISAYGHYGDK